MWIIYDYACIMHNYAYRNQLLRAKFRTWRERGGKGGGEGQIENFALIAINNQIPTANRRNVPEIATGLGM